MILIFIHQFKILIIILLIIINIVNILANAIIIPPPNYSILQFQL